MGNALENIDKLLSIPTGCGEQNMITTVPNIYAMAYLTAINKVKPDFELKAMRYMKHGNYTVCLWLFCVALLNMVSNPSNK